MVVNFIENYSINDDVFLEIVGELARMPRQEYEESLVQAGAYSLDQLSDMFSNVLKKKDVVSATLRELAVPEGHKLLRILEGKNRLSQKVLRILALHGITIGRSLAGDLAKPSDEQSYLEIELQKLGLNTALKHLKQSYTTFKDGHYESSNAMARSALEDVVEKIADRISTMCDEEIPKRCAFYTARDYRQYLLNKEYLDNSEKDLLDKLFNYASGDGSHPGISSESEARLRRFMIIGVCLLFLEKLRDGDFMKRFELKRTK